MLGSAAAKDTEGRGGGGEGGRGYLVGSTLSSSSRQQQQLLHLRRHPPPHPPPLLLRQLQQWQPQRCQPQRQRQRQRGVKAAAAAVGDDPSKLAVYTHTDCLSHRVSFHPESPERLRHLIEDVMPELSQDLEFEVLQPDRNPTREELSRVHTEKYIDAAFEAFEQVRKGEQPSVYLDSDTQAVPGTEDSALRAAGVTLQAVEDVVEGRVKRAFVMVRPPGHHAESKTAMGFCVFNNILIGLAHAQAKYPNSIRKAALLDFDVHHGNGGQEGCYNDPTRFFASTHQAPLFPWKGLSRETGVDLNVINVPLPKDSTPKEFRDAWENEIIPKVKDFGPDIIFISAGFDAHPDDPLASLSISEEDFAYVTQKIALLANEVSRGCVVSVLEGGYDPEALGRCVEAHVRSLASVPEPTQEHLSRLPSSLSTETAPASQMMFSTEQLAAMDKSALRSELLQLGLPTSGRLDALRDRLAQIRRPSSSTSSSSPSVGT